MGDGNGNPALLAVMEQCGHFLYHRRGGKRGQERILRILDDWGREPASSGAGLDQSVLQEMLGIRSGSISEIIGKMEAGGLLRKERPAEDRRRVCLSLTGAGREELARVQAENARQEALLFEGLNGEEQRRLQELLERLLQSWSGNFDSALLRGHRRHGWKGGDADA